MKTKPFNLIFCLLALLPLLLVTALYQRLPDQIPVHWELGGTVEYGGKGLLWILAGVSPVMAILFRVLPKFDPKIDSYENFRGFYDGFSLAMLLFVLLMVGVTLSESLAPGRVSVWQVICCALGILFAFIGNFLPKVSANFFLGFKTPWTLSDPDVWNRTHRLGGQLFFWFGLLLLAAGLLLPETATFILLLGGTVFVALLPLLLSCLWYRRRHPERH